MHVGFSWDQGFTSWVRCGWGLIVREWEGLGVLGFMGFWVLWGFVGSKLFSSFRPKSKPLNPKTPYETTFEPQKTGKKVRERGGTLRASFPLCWGLGCVLLGMC
jgi:hypothetical protein